MPENREILMDGQEKGYQLKVYLDAEKSGFEVVIEKNGKISATKFLEWTQEPRWGLDALDRQRIDEAVDGLLAELPQIQNITLPTTHASRKIREQTDKSKMNNLTPEQQQAIEAEIFAGNKIGAIKLAREVIPGMGLVEAKDLVETLEAESRQKDPKKFKSRPKAGCLGMVLGITFLVIGLVLFSVSTLF